MAIYEYECAGCKNKEIIHRGITENDPGYSCKTCNLPLTRVYSPIGVAFNGNGFYSTDNKGR